METVKHSGKRILDGEAVLPRPEEDAVVARPGKNPSAGRETSSDCGAGADLDAVPDGAVRDECSSADLRPAEDTSEYIEVSGGLVRKDPPAGVETPSVFRERSPAVQRFERRAEEIARAAQIIEGAAVEEPADLVVRLAQERRPEIGDEGRLSGRDSVEHARRQDADARVQERLLDRHSESRDSVPFGLKRRIPVRIPILHDEERGRPSGLAVAGQERRDVGLDHRIRVDDQEISTGKPSGGVSQGTRGAEDFCLREQAQLREIRRAVAQMAYDLFTKMMKIDARFEDAVSRQSGEVRSDQRDV
jgi:hypothetical protein